MQMTISTTGRRQLCILCSVMCYQKCLNFAVLKVLPSGDWWVLSAVSVEVHRSLFGVDLVAEVAYWILSTVCCWSSIGAAVRGAIFRCCRLFVGGSASWCFHQTHLLLGFVRVFGSECPLLRSIGCFWRGVLSNVECRDETCQMVSLQWLEPFDEGQWLVVSDRCLIAFSLLRSFRFSVSEVDLFAGQRSFSGDLSLALISQFVCHNCSVPGFTDGTGFRFGWMRQLLRSIRLLFLRWVSVLKHHLLFVTMS